MSLRGHAYHSTDIEIFQDKKVENSGQRATTGSRPYKSQHHRRGRSLCSPVSVNPTSLQSPAPIAFHLRSSADLLSSQYNCPHPAAISSPLL